MQHFLITVRPTIQLFSHRYFHPSGREDAMLQAGRNSGSRPDGVNEFFSIYLILPAALGPGVYSASNRNE
jgi:hypothetical protein